jgi:hypothetical protein
MVSRRDINHATQLVDQLDLPVRFDLDALIAAVERHRKRPIHCVPAADLNTGEVCGLVVSSPSADVIFHSTSLTPWHREHTIAHELGHLMAGHTEQPAELPTHLAAHIRPMLEDLYPAPLLGKMLGRASFDSTEEQQAELFAALVLAVRESDAVDADVAEVLQPSRSPKRRNAT